jgi:hypothetical protein
LPDTEALSPLPTVCQATTGKDYCAFARSDSTEAKLCKLNASRVFGNVSKKSKTTLAEKKLCWHASYLVVVSAMFISQPKPVHISQTNTGRGQEVNSVNSAFDIYNLTWLRSNLTWELYIMMAETWIKTTIMPCDGIEWRRTKDWRTLA